MLSYEDVARQIQSHQLQRAYLLWGEEPLFVDKLADLFAGHVVAPEERDLNQTILYGHDKEITPQLIASEAMRFPMMGSRVLVVVREAQQVRNLEAIAPYISQLPETTCLVLCYKKKIDKRKALYKAFEALGTHYESARLSDSKVPDFITRSLAARRMQIAPRTAMLMAEHTGSDLEKILGEIEKLSIVLGERGGEVTPELIETHIGISREYNNFELLDALIERDASKAFRIAQFFASNERSYPIQMTLPLLFNYFSQLMAVYYLQDKSDRGISAQLGIAPFVARSYARGVQKYSATAVFGIVRQIRLADASSKGIEANLSGGEILRQLLAYILAS